MAVARAIAPPTPRRNVPIDAAFLLALLLLAVLGWQGLREQRAAREARTRAVASHALAIRTLEMENAVTLMEARHRAFLLNGDDEFRRRRELSHADAMRELAALRSSLDADGADVRALQEIASAVAERHARMLAATERAGREGLEALRADFDPFGSGSIDPIRQRLAAWRDRQRADLARALALADARAARFERLLRYGTTVALATLVLAAWALRRQLRLSQAVSGQLESVRALQAAMLEQGGVMIVATRPDGVIRLFNRAAADALGYGPAELIDRHTPALLHDETELAERAARLRAERGEEAQGFALIAALARRGVARDEWTLVRKDGSRFPVELAWSPVRDAGGRELGYIGMAVDLTARRAAERAVQALNADLAAQAEALAAANAELESFSYSVSHDLRAPLRHIDGYARILQEDGADRLDGELRHYLDRIAHAARRMGGLIDDLLAFSRLSRASLQRQPVAMDALARDALREVAAGAVTVEIDTLPSVPGDPALLRQVWINLLSNAVKYSQPRGAAARVRVQAEVTDQVAIFSVSDNGVGFDMRYRDRLFGVFQRLHGQDEFEGTGVGLAIVQRIVRRHGGRVDAEGALGEGATFRFELPLAEA